MTGREVDATLLNWNIDLIVCYRRNWNRFMKCCCPTSDGWSRRPNRKRIRRSL